MSDRPPLLLHVGSHKTGTTAIQAALAALRPDLARAGIVYPNLKPYLGNSLRDHNALAHRLAEADLRGRFQLWRVRRALVPSGNRLTVLSAEAILRHTLGAVPPGDTAAWFAAQARYLATVAHFLRGFHITALCYLRQPETYALSLYKEAIARGRLNGAQPLLPFLQALKDRFDYPRQIAALHSAFPALETLSFEAEVKTGLLTGFLHRAGAEGLAPPALPDLRTSPGNRATLWLQRHIATADPKAFRIRANFTLRPEAALLFAEDTPSTLWPSVAAQEQFCEGNAASYALPFLQPARITDLPSTVWTDQMQVGADHAFAGWAGANAALLARRAALRLRFFDPDPPLP